MNPSIRTFPNNLACPIDGLPLIPAGNALRCEKGHNYDIAKRGYINLLPVQHKRSLHPGDNRDMVRARKLFLDTELYQPIAQKLSTLIKPLVSNSKIPSSGTEKRILDTGCGEGYYLDHLAQSLGRERQTSNLGYIGLDISKEAINEAAKRNKAITWIVGTNRLPPLLPQSVDVIICMFGFPSLAAFRQLLTKAGYIVLVEPGPNHLQELREIIYDKIKDPLLKNPARSAQEEHLFDLVDKQLLRYETPVIDNTTINRLFMMTPHFHRVKKEKRELAMTLQALKLGIEVEFSLYTSKKVNPTHL